MKLQYQLNIAFTSLLILTLTVTGYLIYSLILDLLIQDEKRQLVQKGELLVNILNQDRNDVQQFSDFIEEQNLQLILYNGIQEQVLVSTMPPETVIGLQRRNNFAEETEELWEYGNDRYVTSKIFIYPESRGLELILLTPLTDLQSVLKNFIGNLLIVFFIGAVAAIFLSYILTKKLVTPLSLLKVQLKKIEKRQFDEIERVEAAGEMKEVEQSVFDMARELERYMKSQQTFFQNASHELKTPLMTIQGYAEGIRDGVFDKDDQEKGLNVMVSEVKRLKAIINEMILLAKLDSESTHYEMSNVRLDTLIYHVRDRTLPLINDTNVDLQLEVEEPLTLKADEEKILRALLNITVNGIRYAKSIVKITAKQTNQGITVSIEDDGEGIPEDLLPHLFHRFVKGKDGETGLGLAISRAIVEQSGGIIQVNNSELGGAKFIMNFFK